MRGSRVRAGVTDLQHQLLCYVDFFWLGKYNEKKIHIKIISQKEQVLVQSIIRTLFWPSQVIFCKQQAQEKNVPQSSNLKKKKKLNSTKIKKGKKGNQMEKHTGKKSTYEADENHIKHFATNLNLKKQGQPGWHSGLSVWLLVSAQVVISGSWH